MKAALIIFSCFMLALCLDILPLPVWVNWLRPEMSLLFLIYWSVAMPERCGILTAAALGILVDVIMGSFIGLHVFAYSLIVSFIALTYRRIRVFNILQQAGFVFLLVGIEQLVEHWLRLLMAYPSYGLWFLLPVTSSALFWPFIVIFMRLLRQYSGLVKHLI
jgi:rod shape-determining protein MreD